MSEDPIGDALQQSGDRDRNRRQRLDARKAKALELRKWLPLALNRLKDGRGAVIEVEYPRFGGVFMGGEPAGPRSDEYRVRLGGSAPRELILQVNPGTGVMWWGINVSGRTRGGRITEQSEEDVTAFDEPRLIELVVRMINSEIGQPE